MWMSHFRSQIVMPGTLFIILLIASALSPLSAVAGVTYEQQTTDGITAHQLEGTLESLISELENPQQTSELDAIIRGDLLQRLTQQKASAIEGLPYRVLISTQQGKYTIEANEIMPESQTVRGSISTIRQRAERPGQHPRVRGALLNVVRQLEQQLGDRAEAYQFRVMLSVDGQNIEASARVIQ